MSTNAFLPLSLFGSVLVSHPFLSRSLPDGISFAPSTTYLRHVRSSFYHGQRKCDSCTLFPAYVVY